ncbi:MAG: MBOAT family protein [Algicola sp.]|nr:MBOAT family protein [Algicola sp.]
MLFNSIDFAMFLPIVFVLYWLLAKYPLRAQNILLVLASYIFYGWWDWRFLSLILFSTVVDYGIGVYLDKTSDAKKRKYLLWASIGVNIGLLMFFKYFNFFVDNFVTAFTFFGAEIKPTSLNIILPVGISFYTFQTLSYTIDVYKKKLKPTHDFIQFSAFVSFFPQLVAGPIERATRLLPQFKVKREFNKLQAADGMRQILWGLFKKIIIADICAKYVNVIFENYETMSASSLILGAVLFAFQIYGDFSGYSDIGIGTARLFGFNLMQNFAFPYFSRDIAEFWRRWHISLSTWFRDYVYIPLGGSKGSKLFQIRNVLIIFLVSGFWHGANWTFIVWGALNAVLFLPLLIRKRNRKHKDIVAKNKILPHWIDLVKILKTFVLTCIAWVFFRSDTISDAYNYLVNMIDVSVLDAPIEIQTYLYVFLVFFICIEWIGRRQQYAIETTLFKYPRFLRWSFYYLITMVIFLYGGETQTFIYFQF